MGYDPLSPIAPARLRALLLPVGRIKRSRLVAFMGRLEAENVVRLGDVSPDSRPNRNMFSPLAFPAGRVVFDLSTSDASPEHLGLSPFEHFRESVAVVAIADGAELSRSLAVSHEKSDMVNGVASQSTIDPTGLGRLTESLAELNDLYPYALVRQIFLFDAPLNTATPEGIIPIPPPEASTTTTMKTIMCDFTASILGELTEYAKYIQGLSSLDSPKPMPDDKPPGMLRTSSFGPQTSLVSGMNGPGSTEDRVVHRMSMPAQLSTKANQITGASGKYVATRIPGASATFDDILRPGSRSSRAETPVSEPSSTEHSRERVSVQGFGSSSVTEKSRNKNKGRIGMVVGSLYLQTGRWPDALKELVESGTIARANSDYLWQAKSLDYIVVCLLMMGWSGMDFQIPQICYPNVTDRISISTSKSSPLPSSTSLTDSTPQPNPANRIVSLQNLATLLPELLNHILNLYTRAANITDEKIPQLAFSETVLRFSKVLTSCHLRDGFLDDNVLEHLVLGHQLIPIGQDGQQKGGAYLRKSELTTRLFRALPPTNDKSLSTRDVCPILVAMSSILSSLGLHRKRAFLLRELLVMLIPSLVHARKISAAEMGIHPAAGLSAIESAGLALQTTDSSLANRQKGLANLMDSLGDIYGILRLDPVWANPSPTDGAASEQELDSDSSEAIMMRVLRHGRLRRFGMLVLKADLLVSCINLCEALPDFHGVLRFAAELLRTMSPGIPLPPDGRVSQFMTRDEQTRLINNIKRTVSAGTKLGLKNLEAEYWDDFLVRGVELLDQSPYKKLVSHSKSELQMAEATQDTANKNPFIYNPFAKTDATIADRVIVCDDHTTFKVDLQNPFQFDLEIERLTLEVEGASFESVPHGMVIAPYSMHTVNVAGFARQSGPLKVTGCVVKVKDCRERRFPIFRNTWKPGIEWKPKRSGLAARNSQVERPVSSSTGSSEEKADPQKHLPIMESVHATVIEPQPTLTVAACSLPQASIMMLEGETKTFTITLHNSSARIPVDFLMISFKDSTTAKLQSAMSNKDMPPADLYELELQVSKKALKWRRVDEKQDVEIKPGQICSFTIEVLGIPGFTEGTVQVDYGCFGLSKSDMKDKFYTRQLMFPLTVTVNASVELVKWDILPFTGNFAWQDRRTTHESPGGPSPHSDSSERPMDGKNQFQSLINRLESPDKGDDHCLLLLDLRNAWPSPLSISMQVRDAASLAQSQGSPDPWRHAYTVHEILQPGHVSRLILLIPRVFAKNHHAPIPTLNSATQRQYVVSATKIPADQELFNRESFWCRAELLKLIRGVWSEDIMGREGAIELRGLRLNARMLDVIRVEDIGISFNLTTPTEDSGSGRDVVQTTRSHFTIQTHAFLTLTTTIRNHSSRPIHPLLRLIPSLRNQIQPTTLDLSKRLVWTGMLQRTLPILPPGGTVDATLGICAMCRGGFEVGASVEEVRVLRTTVKDSESTEEMIDTLALRERERARRIWHAREGCVLVALDGEKEKNFNDESDE